MLCYKLKVYDLLHSLLLYFAVHSNVKKIHLFLYEGGKVAQIVFMLEEELLPL